MGDFRTTSWAAATTTNSYADLGNPWSVHMADRVSIVVANTGASNGAMIQVLGSVDDGTNWDFAWAVDQVLATGASKAISITATALTHVKVQVKAQVADSQTTVAARGKADWR